MAGSARHYASATVPEGRDRAAVRKVAEYIRSSPACCRATTKLVLRSMANLAWDALEWAGIRTRPIRLEQDARRVVARRVPDDSQPAPPEPLRAEQGMDGSGAHAREADDPAFGSEMRASGAAVAGMAHGRKARGVASSASRFGGIGSQAMQAVVGDSDGLSRSRLAFGASVASASASALAGALNGARARGAFGQGSAFWGARGQGGGGGSGNNGADEPADGPAPVPRGARSRSRFDGGRTLGVEGVDVRDLGATPLPQVEEEGGKGAVRRGQGEQRGADGLRGMRMSMLGAGGAVGSRRVGFGLHETMGVGMGVETTYGLYGGSQSTLRQAELEDAAVRPEDIVEERSWREYGLLAPLAKALRRTPAERGAAVLYDYAAVKHSVRVMQHAVELAADGADTSGAVMELAPAAISSILNAHLSLRRLALSPAFRGNTVPITDRAGRVLLGLDAELLDLLHTTEDAALAIARAFRETTGQSLPLPSHLRHALGRLVGAKGFVPALPLPTQKQAKAAADAQAGG